MKLAMSLTLDGLVRALRTRAHIAAETAGAAGRGDRTRSKPAKRKRPLAPPKEAKNAGRP